MTKTATDFASKLAVAFVAVAMVVAAFAPAAQAQSSEDLQQMINDLLAQVAQLQGGTTGGGAAMACDSFMMDLGQGMKNADVMRLQQFLNKDADTRVSATGAGSMGMETSFYGPATAAAVSKFQVKYRAEILSPLGLVNPTGYMGAGTRAKANALCTANVTPEEEEEAEEEMEEEESMTLGGEAALDTFELDDGESSIEEGDEDVEIGEITIEFDNGDAEISRIDVTLVGATSDQPWDAFDTISLWVDGDKIAEVDASDEDDYLDEDDGELRFSNLGLIAMEDEELTIVVGASVQNNLDSEELTDWDLEVSSMRFFDADGVATTEQDPAGSDKSEFEVEKAGENEELNISLASSNPDATDIVVDTDSDTNDVTIMVTEIEAEDNDIELNKVVVLVETGTASTSKIVDDIRVIIDGESFDAESVSSTLFGAPTTNMSRMVDVTGTAVWYVFDIDGDVVIDEDEEVDMEVVVDFNDTDDGARYSNGSVIKASVTSTERDLWKAEGADDLEAADNQFSGSSVGDQHTLVAEGIILPVGGVETSTKVQGENASTLGVFEIEFEVTAVEGDFYITDNSAPASTTPTDGLSYVVVSPSGATVPVSESSVVSATADEDTDGVFTVREGETETFTLKVDIDAATAGNYRLRLDSVFYAANANGVTGAVEFLARPTTDFRTGFQVINN